MQVSVEAPSALERRVTVRMPAGELERAVQSRLQTLAKKVRVDGFRPGKVPFKIVQRLYGQQALADSTGELISKSLKEALNQENLQPLTPPAVTIAQPQPESAVFEYSATFEVAPQVDPSGLETIQVVRPVAEITDQDVGVMMERLRWQYADWNVVDRPSAPNDRITIDFTSQIGGQEVLGGKREHVPLILDGKFKDFESHLLGLSAGAEVAFDLVLPDHYPNPDLAGKSAHFQVTVRTVEAATLPVVDDAFAAKFEVEGIDKLRHALRVNMERNLREQIKVLVKRQVVRGLLKANPVPLSRPLVDAEIQRLAAERLHFPKGMLEEQKIQIQRQLFGMQAYQRVATGLLIRALVQREGIQVEEQRVRQILETYTADFESPETAIESYQKNPEAMSILRALALEEQVIDWILARAQVTDQPSTFFAIMETDLQRLPGEWGEGFAPVDAGILMAGVEAAPHE